MFATLAARSVASIKYSYLSNAGRSVVQFIAGVILARLLDPTSFGLVALGWLVIAGGKLVADAGLAAALVQQKSVEPADIGFVFSIQVAIAIASTVTAHLCSSALGTFFGRPDAGEVIAAMSWLFILQAIGQPFTSTLSRSLRFGVIQLASFTTYVVGYLGVGVPLAYLGWGVWSLVLAQLTQSSAYALWMVLATRVNIQPSFRPQNTGLFAFGGKVILANLTSWILSNQDSIIVARTAGVVDLGLYNRTVSLVTSLGLAVTAALQPVLLSTCSRAQHDHKRIEAAFIAATQLVGYLCLPVLFTIAVVPQTVVIGLYSAKWSGAIPLVLPLALAMAVHALLAMIGPVLTAVDRVRSEILVQIAVLAVGAPALIFASSISVAAVAWVVLGIYLVRWVLLLGALCRFLNLSVSRALWSLKYPSCVAASAAGVACATDFGLPVMQHDLLRVAVVALAALSGVLVSSRVLGTRLLAGPIQLFVVDRGLLPRSLALWLGLARQPSGRNASLSRY